MASIRFRVKSNMTWNGRDYERGDRVDIPEGHPYLGVDTWRRRFLAEGEAVSAASNRQTPIEEYPILKGSKAKKVGKSR